MRRVAAALLTGAALTAAPPALARPMTADDYLKVQTLDTVQAAPDGDLVAVSVSRAALPGDVFRAPDSATNALPPREDLIVLSASDGRVVLRIEGFKEGGSAFAPAWSPGGTKLAFLRADRSGRVSLRVWDADSGKIATLVQDGVRVAYPPLRAAKSTGSAGPIAWLSPSEIAFTRVGDSAARAVRDPARLTALAERGEASVRIWKTGEIPFCQPDDVLSVVSAPDGKVVEVARGPVLGVSFSPDSHAVVVVLGKDRIQPPPTDPLPAHRMARGGESPFVRWEAQAFQLDDHGWRPVGAPIPGRGPIMEDSLPRWSADGRDWATLDTPNPYAQELAGAVSRTPLGGSTAATTAYATRPEAVTALMKFESAKSPTAGGPLDSALESQLGPGAAAAGVTGAGTRLFRNRVRYVTTLWGVRGAKAVKLLDLNAHLGDVTYPAPIAIEYQVDGEARTGWLFLPEGAGPPPPVTVTAYPLTRPFPADALPPEGTFPVLPELLTKGVAVYVADLRIRNPPAIDEPTARIVSEMAAAMKALKASGKVDAGRAAFFGHSFGGYTALNLLAHSDDFRAIVAAAPLGDLAAYAFSGSDNYDQACGPAQVPSKQMMHEYLGSSDLPPVNNLVMKLGGPPYARLDKYVRNSPLLDMGKAHTPTLIIQGSDDGFLDGERTFNTLNRMGVEAELLWYWGEGHLITGPANLRDMTRRSVAWILEKLKPLGQVGAADQRSSRLASSIRR